MMGEHDGEYENLWKMVGEHEDPEEIGGKAKEPMKDVGRA
jgi:hypothetical protein